MNILLTGGTGFIGSHLSEFLESKGARLTVVTRSPDDYRHAYPERTYITIDQISSHIDQQKAVVNLAGENLFDRRWTRNVKKRIVESRVDTTRAVVDSINNAESPPDVLISASAVGFYGDRGAGLLTENDPPGNDFVADVCVQWEQEAQKVNSATRLVIPRIAIAMHPDGGALKKFLLPFRFFAGGPLGDGDQYLSWVHMRDIVEAIWFMIDNQIAEGACNLASPDPVTMELFAKAIGEAMNRPSWLRVPQFALYIALGQAATGITASIRLKPQKLLEWGFTYTYPRIGEAMNDLIGS